MVQAGQLSLCFPGQEQAGPSSLGTHSTFACASQKPQAKLSPNTEMLWLVPPLRACPRPGSVAAGPSSAPKPAAGGTRAGSNPSSPIPNAAAWLRTHPQASPPPSLLLQPPALAEGDVSGGDRAETPPRHTRIPAALPFGVKSAGEFQLFQHLYLFWLQFLFRPRYKLEAALLLTSSKLHLLTSLPQLLAGRGLLLAGADALALEVCRKPRSLFSPHPPSLAQGANKGSLQKELVIADG